MSLIKITVLKWHEHNPKHKKGYRKSLIAHSIVHDPVIGSLPAACRWLFAALLLLCGEQGGDTVVLTWRQLASLLGNGQAPARCLELLQQLQLVSVEKDALIKLKETKLKETKLNLTPAMSEKPQHELAELPKDPKPVKPKPSKSDTDANRLIKTAYVNAFRLRYGVDPVTGNATFNTQVSSLRKRLGVDDAIRVVEFYLTHNDSFYLKKTHAFGLCLADAETLFTQLQRGKQITQNEIRRFEKTSQVLQMAKDADEGGF